MFGHRDDGPRCGLADEVVQLGLAGAMTDAHDDDAGPFGADERGVHQRAVGHEHHGAVAALEPGADERSGDAVGRTVVVEPRHAVAVLVDERGAVRVRLHMVADAIGEGVGAPPPGGGVRRDVVRRRGERAGTRGARCGRSSWVDGSAPGRGAGQNALGSRCTASGTGCWKSSEALRHVMRSMSDGGSPASCSCSIDCVLGHVESQCG